jgi:transposase-like protein
LEEGLSVRQVAREMGVGLSTLSKWIRVYREQGGSRTRGLQEIEYAAKYGKLTHGEALFYLAKDYSRANERQFAKSLELFQQLRSQYPRNGLWTLLVGSLEIRVGHAEQGEAFYRQLLGQTHGNQAEARKALYNAVQRALEDLQQLDSLPSFMKQAKAELLKCRSRYV